ncbi:MAG TPA: GNAT family N-acetyltransferase [Pyrinomonadaceae bacterium]|nr:GNAT family N-acetyltransferase [Pyrinomonadaceae bacterium]
MTAFTLRSGVSTDAPEIVELYKAVAAAGDGLARAASEVSMEYVENFVSKSLENGLIIVARHNATDDLIGEIHSYGLGIRAFAHVLGELTIAVHPAHQGIGVGRALFSELLRRVTEERPEILRVELVARESNKKAIALYEKIGFRVEGRFEHRITSPGGGYEADIPMAWYRPRVSEGLVHDPT